MKPLACRTVGARVRAVSDGCDLPSNRFRMTHGSIPITGSRDFCNAHVRGRRHNFALGFEMARMHSVSTPTR